MVIITSDHGEGFAEESELDSDVRMLGHGWGVHEVLTHVPLLVKHPGQKKGKAIRGLSSLTRLPDVIRSSIDPEIDAESFEVEEFAIASTYRLFRDEKEAYMSDKMAEKHRGPWRALYTGSGGSITKYMKNNDTGAVIEIEDAQSKMVVGEDASIVDDIYGSFGNKHILSRSDEKDITAELEERLRNLGYIT